ncbi:MAG: restriction endonuclease subunit S [Candidatus Brocadiae bacterium]|nr:restriction endonuclease subunit S [Candidatus Brocadiia bacterium]
MAKDSTIKKGYKQTEIGIIPEDWEVKKLGDCCNFKVGNLNSDQAVYGGDYPFFTCSQETFQIDRYSFDCEALILAGNNASGIYSLKYYKGKFDVYQRTYVITIKNVGLINYFYLQNVLQTQLDILKKDSFGTSTKFLTLTMLLNLEIPFISFTEQTAIAELLSDTDALTKNLEKQIAKKKAIKQGTMQQLLTGKKRLPGFSGEWEVKKLGEIFQFLSTANNPRADLSISGDIGYIHYGDIHTNTSVFLNCDQSNLPTIEENRITGIPLVEEGDLVMADASEDYAGIGKCMEIQNVKGKKIIAGLHTFLLRGNPGLLASGFKGYLQFIPEIKASLVRFATGISVYGVSKSNVKSIEARIPAIQEQTAIAEILSDMDSEIEVLEQKCAKYKQIKQGMMHQLLTGKIRLV